MSKAKKMGRPKGDRHNRMWFSASDEERALIEAAAEAESRPAAQWVRLVAIRAAKEAQQ